MPHSSRIAKKPVELFQEIDISMFVSIRLGSYCSDRVPHATSPSHFASWVSIATRRGKSFVIRPPHLIRSNSFTIRVIIKLGVRSTSIGITESCRIRSPLMSRSINQPTNLQVLASALATIPGSTIRVRQGQTPTRSDAMQSLFYTLSLMTASQRQLPSRGTPSRTSIRRSSAA